MEYSFEDKIDVINEQLAKRRGKWQLTALAHMDYDDVSQIIRLHIYKKWHLWNQSRPLENWLNAVISNQLLNLIRNNYGNVAPPCRDCRFNEGGEHCGFTRSGLKTSECGEYKKWSKRKRDAYYLKLANSIHDDNYTEKEFSASQPDDQIDFEGASSKLHEKMEGCLSKYQWLIYKLLYIDGLPEGEVAQIMGYKTNEKNRQPGYRQLQNIKKMIVEKARLLLEREDIIDGYKT